MTEVICTVEIRLLKRHKHTFSRRSDAGGDFHTHVQWVRLLSQKLLLSKLTGSLLKNLN